MSRITAVAEELSRWRYAKSKAAAMLTVLADADPPGFKIDLKLRGHFSSSSTYNQTEAPGVDEALTEVIRARLPELLADTMKVIEAHERRGISTLLRVAVETADGEAAS